MELEYTQDDIDAFVQGKISPEERNVFVQKMKENPALAEAVAEARFALDVGIELRKRELRKLMNTWDNEKKTGGTSSNSQKRPTPGWQWWATAVVVLAAGIYFFNQKPIEGPLEVLPQNTPATDFNNAPGTTPVEIAPSSDTVAPEKVLKPNKQPQHIFASRSFSERGQIKANIRGDQSTSVPATQTQKGLALYFQKKYAQAIATLRGIPPVDPDYYEAQIIMGDAYFQLQQFLQAEKAYLIVEKTEMPDYTDAVDWNLLMTYLAQYPLKQTEFKNLKDKITSDPKHPAVADKRMEHLNTAMQQWR